MTIQLPETQFCGLCGHENLATVDRCASCGSVMSSEFDPESATAGRPLQWRWTEILLGTLTAALLMFTFVPVLRLVFMPLEFPRYLPEVDAFAPNAILLRGGMVTVLPLLLVFAVAGLVLGIVANRSIYREVALGAVAGAAVHWFLWFVMAGWKVKALLLPLVALSGGGVSIHLPPVLFLLTVHLLGVGCAVGAARLGVVLAELISGRTHCYTCNKIYSVRPTRPMACPACGTPVLHRGVSWVWAGPTMAATMVAFYLLVSLAGAPLKIYWPCDFRNFSPTCRQGVDRYNEQQRLGGGGIYYWANKVDRAGRKPGAILDSYRYLGLLAPLFMMGPLIIAWRCRRNRLRTAGVTVLLNWGGAFLVAMTALGFAQFEGVFMLSVRLHLMAGLVWCVAGAVGLGIGSKLAQGGGLDPELME